MAPTGKPRPLAAIERVAKKVCNWRAPYQKPEVKVIDLGNLMQRLEETEGELYREFNGLADRLEEIRNTAGDLEVAIAKVSEKVDEAKIELAKVQFAVEVRASAEVPRQG